jgi:hypothetical protein
VIEMRWLLSRTQLAGTFSEPIPWPDGSTVYARLQYRELGIHAEGTLGWREIPIESEVRDEPKLELVPRH